MDRDDLIDGGSAHLAATVQEIKKQNPDILVEVLTPDFGGDLRCVDTVVESGESKALSEGKPVLPHMTIGLFYPYVCSTYIQTKLASD